MIRYADDFVILTKTKEEAEEALRIVEEWMKEHDLALHPEKTHIWKLYGSRTRIRFLRI